MKNKFASVLAGLLIAISLCAQTNVPAPLTAGEPIPLSGTTGGFDFIRVDTGGNRLLLGHEGNKSFDVVDLKSKKLLKAVPTGTSQDGAADVKRGNYYVSGNDPGRMVIVDASNLTVTAEIPLPAASDIIGFNPDTGLVHVCNDAAAEQWLIDPVAKKIVTTITFDGKGLEDMVFDLKKKLLYQAVKGANTIGVLDLTSNKVVAAWPLAPDKGPHGIALAPEINRLLVACAGKLVMLDCTSGKVVATAPIGARVDEMTYDSDLHRAYCASRQGKISVVEVAADKLTALADVPDANGAGDIAVDSKTHTVWVAYEKDGQCFVQPFAPAKK
ncbi:MAG TPA: YncE family protein [Candidatus Baltobacteraceae bacterium]|nr:YncE family protein [Candidatus Baltobacteraceae bacterium]